MFSLGPILASPAIANNTVYIASADGNIYALQ
jgi:outer membrane protein assembly factor BamB